MEQQESNKSKLPVILGAALILSLGFNTYQFIDGKQNFETLDQSVKEISTLNASKTQLEFDYKNLQDEFNQLKKSIVDNDGLLANKEYDIKVKQEEIDKILNDANASKKQLAKAESMIKSLRSEITSYKTEIVRLEKENAILVKNNAILTTERDSIQTNLNTEKTERIVERKIAKDKEDELSSTLSVSNHSIAALKVKNNGKEVEKSKAKKVDKIRVSFDIDQNLRAQSGPKELYISVINPNGTVGQYQGADFGTLKLHSGEDIKYSDRVNINYQNGAQQKVEFDLENGEFIPGKYVINVYQNGFKISQADVILK